MRFSSQLLNKTRWMRRGGRRCCSHPTTEAHRRVPLSGLRSHDTGEWSSTLLGLDLFLCVGVKTLQFDRLTHTHGHTHADTHSSIFTSCTLQLRVNACYRFSVSVFLCWLGRVLPGTARLVPRTAPNRGGALLFPQLSAPAGGSCNASHHHLKICCEHLK